MDSSKDNKLNTTLVVMLVIVGISLIPWALAAFTSLFAFDAPGSEKELSIWLMVVPIWIYPVIAVGCMAGSIILMRKTRLRPALIMIAIPLAAIVLWIICTGIYLGLQPR